MKRVLCVVGVLAAVAAILVGLLQWFKVSSAQEFEENFEFD